MQAGFHVLNMLNAVENSQYITVKIGSMQTLRDIKLFHKSFKKIYDIDIFLKIVSPLKEINVKRKLLSKLN